MITNLLIKWITDLFVNLNWLIENMDITQWGIVSAVFVLIGFMALKTRF
jgi:hypothetical protein